MEGELDEEIMWPSHDVRDPRELEAALEDGPGEILTDGPLGPRVLDVPEVLTERDDEPLGPEVIDVPDPPSSLDAAGDPLDGRGPSSLLDALGDPEPPEVLDVPEVIAEHDDEPLEPVVIHVPDAAAAGAPDAVAEESTDPISLHDAGTPCLVMATAEGRERCFPLGALNILVGRSKSADIVVDGEGVALFHVRIEPTGDGRHRVIDLDARSGTLLNGEPIEYAALVPGDVLTLGDTELRYTRGLGSLRNPPALPSSVQPSVAIRTMEDSGALLQAAAESGLLPRVSMASSLPVRPTSAQVLRRPPTGPVAPVRLPEPDVIDRLAQIVAFWRRYRALLLALPMLGLVAGLLSPRLIPPPMVAQFELSLVQDPSDNPVDPVARRNLTFFRSARDNFLSPELVAHTLQELGEPEPAPELVAQTQERLAFERASQYMYHGSYEAPEGEDATTFLRVHLDLFLETEVAKAIKVLTAEVETLRTELTDVDAELTSVEATRAAFKMEAGDAQPEHTLALQRRMLDLRDDRREAASMADRMGATVDIAKSRLGSEDPILEQRIADAKPFTEEITATEKQLIAARAQGQGDEHPNVKGLEARLAGLEDRHQEMLDKGGDHIEVRSNPAYAKAKLSLSEARSLHKVARSDLARTEAEIEQLEKVLEELPAREAEQAALDRRYEALQKQHDEMQIRLASSELQLALERRQIEARFDLVKPPTAAPQSDREVVLTRAGVGTLLGLVMAVMLGMGHTTWERVGERIAAQQPRPGDSTIDALSRANALAVRPASTTLAPRPPSNRYRAVERKRRVTRSVPAVRRDRPRRR